MIPEQSSKTSIYVGKVIKKTSCLIIAVFTFFFSTPIIAFALDATQVDRNTIFSPSITIFLAVILSIIFFVFLKLLQENRKRKELQKLLDEKAVLLNNYSQQINHFGLAATSILSMDDETEIYQMISDAIIEFSDYNRLMISLFRDEFPHREVIAHAGLEEETVAKMITVSLSKNYFQNICNLAVKVGQCSYYIPHTMKHIFNQEAVIYGEGLPPKKDEEGWHPEDNLIVNMRDEKNNIIGVISVDSSKSGNRPTDELVRPLEIFASFISQIIIQKRGKQKQRDLEEQLQQVYKLEAIGNITGGMAHDFNNTLGIILGNSDLALLHTSKESPIHENLQEIKQAGTRARDIVQKFLSFSRKSDSEFKPINIISIVEESISFLRSTIPSTIEIQQNIQIGEATILTEANQFYQVLLNLCTNGVHAMEKDGGILTVSINTLKVTSNSTDVPGDIEDGQYAKIVISDTGTGINKDIIHRIFDPHFSTKSESESTGMGLSQVKSIMEKHDGKILVNSSSKTGTSFILFFPLYVESETDTENLQKTLLSGSEHILFIDDDESLLSLGKIMLEQLGYTVTAEADPSKALELYTSTPAKYDLIITDMTMPQMTGDILAKKILDHTPSAKIILCTGYSDIINDKDAEKIGILGYYEKPLTIQPFSAAIRRVIERH